MSFKVPWEEKCKGQMSSLSISPCHFTSRFQREVKEHQGVDYGQLLLTRQKTSQKTRVGVLQEQKNHTPGVSQSFVEAKSCTEPGVFKEDPKINQPVLKVLCDCFPSHRENTIFNSSRFAPWIVTTGGWWGEEKAKRWPPKKMRLEKRRGAGETKRRQAVAARGSIASDETNTHRWVPREGGERWPKSPLPASCREATPAIEGPLSTSPLTASVSHLQNGESE